MLFSAHDTTVVPLLLALRVFDDKWPDFAADVAFELYRDKVWTTVILAVLLKYTICTGALFFPWPPCLLQLGQ